MVVHIDSTIMALRPGVVCLMGQELIKKFPRIFKNWKKIYFNEIVKLLTMF